MLIDKINFLQPVKSKSFEAQNRQSPSQFPKQLERDVFVKFTGAEQKCVSASPLDIYAYIDSLRNDPKHPERKDLFNEQLLYEIAMVDVLTGLKNKRALFTDLEKDIKTAKEQGKGISLAMFDMDNFKSINDLFDHDTGDTFLEIIGEEINAVAKQNGYSAYRFGGEEFIVVMPGANVDAAAKIAEEISKNINQNHTLQEDEIPKLENQRYLDAYLLKAQEKTAELKAMQKPFVDFKKQFAEYEIREKIFFDLKNVDSTIETRGFLAKNMTDSIRTLKASFQKLLEHTWINATSTSDKKYLSEKIRSFQQSGEVKNEYDDDLKNFLNTRYNKDFEIAQIATWVNHVKKPVNGKPQGFTITVGVKEFSDLNALANTLPCSTELSKALIEGADKILINGKKECRGKVYKD